MLLVIIWYLKITLGIITFFPGFTVCKSLCLVDKLLYKFFRSGSDTTVLIQLVLKLFESETDTKSSLSQPVTGTTHKAPYFEEDIALTSLNLINSLSCNAFHFN